MKDKRKILITGTISLAVIVFVFLARLIFSQDFDKKSFLRVGFVYDGDESIPYTNNFIRSQHRLEEIFGEQIQVFAKSNVSPDYIDDALDDLIQSECDIIFTTNYSQEESAREYAEKYPKVQFCQAFGDNAAEEKVLPNYHTFMGEIYQGRYVSGVLAGLKLNELLERGEITESEAKVGFIATYPFAEMISGYTAFFLGVRSVAPYAVMTVRYTYSWSNFSVEKSVAKKLIDEGCVIISQHTETIGPAVACEESVDKTVFHIGYNQSMIDVAPRTSLVSTRINWTPYMQETVSAVLKNKKIEKVVRGHIHGNDIGAGFDLNWVQILDFNPMLVSEKIEERVRKEVQDMKKGKTKVFYGDYIGVNPFDEDDIYDLRKEYKENATSSAPKFCYVLKDVITIEEDTLF